MLIRQVIEDTIHCIRVCVCVGRHACVLRDHTQRGGLRLGTGDEFPPLIPFLRLGPALLLARRKSDGNAITIS